MQTKSKAFEVHVHCRNMEFSQNKQIRSSQVKGAKNYHNLVEPCTPCKAEKSRLILFIARSKVTYITCIQN